LAILSDDSEIWREGTDLGRPSPALNFVKIAQGICPLGEIFTKNLKFSRFLFKPIPIMLKFCLREQKT